MTGDQDDLLRRIKTALPPGWFGAATPALDTVLHGFASVGSWAYALMQYAAAQTRIGTSTDGWLDIAAADYLGDFPRGPGETDADYAARIVANMLPRAGTRDAMTRAIAGVTGKAPRLIELFRPCDTGVWDGVQTATRSWDSSSGAWDDAASAWDDGLTTKGAVYWDVDTPECPFRWAGGDRFTAYIETSVPTVPLLGGAPVPCYEHNFFWDTAGSSVMDLPHAAAGIEVLVNTAERVKVLGTQILMRIATPQTVAPQAGPIAAFEHNFYVDGPSFWS